MMREQSIRSIAVVGSSIAALYSALAFARSLPGVTVSIIETMPEPGEAVDLVATTWPGVTSFHSLIGVSEKELIVSGIGTYHLGTVFEGWSATRTPWIHAFGSYGKTAGNIPFDQIWLRALRSAEALPYDRYAVGAALARAGKFVHPAQNGQGLGSLYQYGLRLHPERYRDCLTEHAVRAGIFIASEEIEQIDCSGERLDSLLLSSGTRVEADLFIDCTGPAARILTSLDDSFEDWSAWMPFDRVLIETEQTSGVARTADRVRATDDGWSIDWPLGWGIIRAILSAGGEGLVVRRGRRSRPWVGNVLALGDAAAAFDPLHGVNLEVTQKMILLALELLPGRDFCALESAEYNRRAELLTSRVRDFIGLHYLCSGLSTGVWRSLESQDAPDSLRRTLDQYRHRGRLPFHEEESVSRDSWSSALLGLGVVPENVDPQSEIVPLSQAVQAMADLASEIDEAVAAIPNYSDYLARISS